MKKRQKCYFFRVNSLGCKVYLIFFMFVRSYCFGNLQYQIEVSFLCSEKLKKWSGFIDFAEQK